MKFYELEFVDEYHMYETYGYYVKRENAEKQAKILSETHRGRKSAIPTRISEIETED